MPHITERTGDESLDDRGIQLWFPDDNLIELWDPANDEAFEAPYWAWVDAGVIPPNLSYQDIRLGLRDGTFQQEADSFFAPPAARGGGGGRTRAPYQRPDDRLVRGAVEGAWAQLAGSVSTAGVESAIAAFYRDDRANYDNEGQQLDPMETVLEMIRKTDDYKAIHTLRSEGTDERTWISSKVGKLLSAGVSDRLAQELGVAQAQAGAAAPTVQAAGEVATLVSTGRMLDSQKAKLRKSMGASLGLL